LIDFIRIIRYFYRILDFAIYYWINLETKVIGETVEKSKSIFPPFPQPPLLDVFISKKEEKNHDHLHKSLDTTSTPD